MDAATVGKTLSELGSQPSYCSWGDNRRVLWRLCQNVLVFCGVREWSNGRGLYLRRTYAAIVRRALSYFGSPAIVPSQGRQSEGSMCLMSKCASVLRCPGGAKRTCAYIKQTYGRRNRPQSTIRFWQSSHRTVLSVRVKILNTRKRAWGGSLVGFFMPSAAEPALLDASICLHALAAGGCYVLQCWILLKRGRVSGVADVSVCWLRAFAPNGEHNNPVHFSSLA